METKEKLSSIWMKLIRATAFLLILAVVLGGVSKLVVSPNDYRNYQWVRGFYHEPKDSIDVIFVGSSLNYASVNSMVIWNRSGITSWNYATSSQPVELAEYVIREGIKRQPNALYVVNLNTLESELKEQWLHYLTDYMPMSRNKLGIIDRYIELREQRSEELFRSGSCLENIEYDNNLKWEFILPLLIYHSRWDDLNCRDFRYQFDGVKSAPYYSNYLKDSKDISDKWITTDRKQPLTHRTNEAIQRLLALIEEKQIHVLFTLFPRVEISEDMIAYQSTLYEMLTEQGYTVLDLRKVMDTVSLAPTSDYYDGKHTNIHGAIKLSSYIADYLQMNYGFTDKRQDLAYLDWNQAADKYLNAISPYYFDIELDVSHRDYDLSAPKLTSLTAENCTATLTWGVSEGAEGYRIYRKEKDPDGIKDDIVGRYLKLQYDITGWTQVAETDRDTLVFVDSDLTEEHVYYYTVVPFTVKDGEKYFGNFNYFGKSTES